MGRLLYARNTIQSRLNVPEVSQSRFATLLVIFAFLTTISLTVNESSGQTRSSNRTQERRTIILNVSTGARSQAGTQHRWLEALQDVGADRVKISTRSRSTPAIDETKTTRSTIITVTGVVSGNNLILPGGKFKMTDKSGMRELFNRLRDDGAKVALAEKKAFGLTSEQLVGVHTKLAKTVDFDTAGQKAGDVFKKIKSENGLTFLLDEAAAAAFNSEEKVAEEFNGMSTGTALAAIARPLGLVMVPNREQGKDIVIHIIDSRASKENWPIGWPIKAAPVAVEPKLFDKLPIEIRDFKLKSALDAIEKRAGVLFLYDHNTLAREGIELTEVKVTLVQKKGSLLVAVSKLLRQTKPRLAEEIRLDENGKAFLWITVP